MTKLNKAQMEDAEERFAKGDWRKDAGEGETLLGYADWLMEEVREYLESDELDDYDIAEEEGWCIIDKDESGLLQIQKDDSQGAFDDDDSAYAYVQTKAEQGSLYHLHALHICKRSRDETPVEYECEVYEKLHHTFDMGKFTAESPRAAAQEAHDAFLNLEGQDYYDKESIESNDREVTVRRVSDGKEFEFSAGDDVEEELDEDEDDD